MRDDSSPEPDDKIRAVICLGTTEHEIACLSDALTSNFPRNRAFPSIRTPRIGRTLAGHMMGMAADISSSSPEARWQSIFGNSYIGATFTHGSDWVVLADDDGQPHPDRRGRLVQLIFPHHLPVAFTSSAEQSAKPGSVQRRLRGRDRTPPSPSTTLVRSRDDTGSNANPKAPGQSEEGRAGRSAEGSCPP